MKTPVCIDFELGKDMSRRTPAHRHVLAWLVSIYVCSLVWAQDRPATHPKFTDGFRAFENKKWEQAVEIMWEADKIWPEDGELFRISGKAYEPYLPRYYMGIALYELGCYKDAADRLDSSILNQDLVIKGTKKERAKLRLFRQKCEAYLEIGIEVDNDATDCTSWRQTPSPEESAESGRETSPSNT